jgi:hypothetical protein
VYGWVGVWVGGWVGGWVGHVENPTGTWQTSTGRWWGGDLGACGWVGVWVGVWVGGCRGGWVGGCGGVYVNTCLHVWCVGGGGSPSGARACAGWLTHVVSRDVVLFCVMLRGRVGPWPWQGFGVLQYRNGERYEGQVRPPHTHASHTYIHTSIHSYMHIHIHAHMYTYIHTYTHSYIHTYIHAYMRSYLHACTPSTLAHACVRRPVCPLTSSSRSPCAMYV